MGQRHRAFLESEGKNTSPAKKKTNVELVELLMNQKNLWGLSYKDNGLSFFNQDNDNYKYTSSRLKEIIFDKLGLYVYTGLGEDSSDTKWWSCRIKEVETYASNEIVAMLECVALVLKDKQNDN